MSGTKNTSDPESYQNPISEGAGAVASDSLAAESVRSGGGFGENRDSNPLSVEGGKSTLNNTDTSGATTLAAASDAQTRDAGATSSSGGSASQQGGKDEQPFGTSDTDTSDHGVGGASAAKASGNPSGSSSGAQPSSTGGNTSSSSGADQTSSYAAVAGGASSSGNNDSSSGSKPSDTTSSSGNNDSSSTSAGDSNVDTAPSYVASIHSDPAKSGKPHGKSLTEGGFDADDSKNASFTSEIGSKDDPGLKAEGDFQKTAQSASGATGPRQGTGGQDEGGNYGALDTEQSL